MIALRICVNESLNGLLTDAGINILLHPNVRL